MEGFGESIKRVFTGIGNFVESTGKAIKSVIVGIGEAVGNVVDKITKMRTAGTEATTKQIKELSDIPADKLFSAAKGVDAILHLMILVVELLVKFLIHYLVGMAQ